MPKSRLYKIGLNERLKNPEHAVAYLNAAKRESQEVFMLALRDVADAHKIANIAATAKVNRETLYRTLSARGNPTLSTLDSILEAIGVDQEFRVRTRRRTARLRGAVPSIRIKARSAMTRRATER
jgi:probable addiction module antidote protein